MSEQVSGARPSPTAPIPAPVPDKAAGLPDGDAPDQAASIAVESMWQVIRRLPAYARVATAIARDPRVPSRAKAMLVAGGLYLVSPIDLVPGIIPVAGQLDDLYVVLTGLQQAIRLSPPEVVNEHFTAAGLAPGNVDDDLATIRAFVRRGVTWTIQKSGQVLSLVSKQVSTLASRARSYGASGNDQKPL